jgi:hypothetical protein
MIKTVPRIGNLSLYTARFESERIASMTLFTFDSKHQPVETIRLQSLDTKLDRTQVGFEGVQAIPVIFCGMLPSNDSSRSISNCGSIGSDSTFDEWMTSSCIFGRDSLAGPFIIVDSS